MRFVLAVLAVSLQLVLSKGAPATHKDRRSWYGGQLTVTPETKQNCSIFLHPYCNGIGYSTALFPNRRDQYYDAASREFGDFTSLLQSGCSNKLGTLLCFFYFPFCDVSHWQSTLLDSNLRDDYKPVMPCRETCQEVRNKCESTLQAHGFSWPSHFDCSKEYFLPVSESKPNCANGTVNKTLTITEPKELPGPTEGESGDEDPCQGNDVNSDCPNSTEQPGTSEPTEESTTQEPTEESTTNLPTEEPTVACTCPRCDVRSTCTANTFKRNGYTFAAKVRVLSTQNRDGTHTYSVHVLKQYSLKSAVNRTMVPAPDMADYIVLHGNPHCCGPCPTLQTGKTYMIGGHYQRSPSIRWDMRSDDSLASQWKPKYDKKQNMQKWIENGNVHRLNQLQNGIEGR